MICHPASGNVEYGGDVPVSGVPVAIGAGGHMTLSVALIPDVHVPLDALPALCTIPVKHFDFGCSSHCYECIPCTEHISLVIMQ